MTPLLIGQILGVSFACGLNLYLTVAALGLLSRAQIIQDLPPGLQGLEGLIVIGSAAALYLVEAVIDKIGHADSIWDTIHTFIRPPAAALLALGALWGHPVPVLAIGAAMAFFVAFAAHGTKAGLRVTLNATPVRGGHAWISIAEDLLALAFATMAFLDPTTALLGTGGVLVLLLLFGPRYWRAFRLGLRALGSWLRSLFSPARWREEEELPRRVRSLIDPTPLGAAPPKGARGAIDGMPGVGGYRNGWLVVSHQGSAFVYRSVLGTRRVDLPPPRDIHLDAGVWANVVAVECEEGTGYRLYLLKDGPPIETITPHLQQTTP